MIPIAIDIESTTYAKGNPFAAKNKLVLAGSYCNGEYKFYDETNIKDLSVGSDHLVLTFNGKFDLNWLRRYGIDTSNWNIWDCQLAHFILKAQKEAYPSLNDVAKYYELGCKIDVIKEEYWDKEIDTDKIPLDILTDYLKQDLLLTYQIYERQKQDFIDRNQYNLFRIQCRDLVALHEMEYNGLLFDYDEARKMEVELTKQIYNLEVYIKMQYNMFIKDQCWDGFNFNSHDHLKALLHGGEIIEDRRIPNGFWKSGLKQGQVRYKIERVIHKFDKLIEPLRDREGKVSTDVKTLRQYQFDVYAISIPDDSFYTRIAGTTQEILKSLIERSRLNKILSTYLKGLLDLFTEKDWKGNLLHPNYNQCVVRTGRLSSSSPNGQNLSGDILNLIKSRYDD